MTEEAFLDYVQAGGQVEVDDWMPDEYRAKLIRFVEMHANSELMGVLPEREWILRAPRSSASSRSPRRCRTRSATPS